MSEVELKPGDALYYAPHSAVGVLIDRYSVSTMGGKDVFMWKYSLRSPLQNNKSSIVARIHVTEEERILTNLASGSLEYWKARR